MDPDLYLVYRLGDRILTSNGINRPVRFAVRRGVECEASFGALKSETIECQMAQFLPDIDKATNFDIWASQVVSTMSGNPNAMATSTAGTLIVNIPMLKELMGKPAQLACVLGHELAHITQNHSEEKLKKRAEYEFIAAQKISERVDSIQRAQSSSRGFAMFMGGLSAGLSGNSSSLNSIQNRIALENISSQIASPQIVSHAMKFSPEVGTAINKMQGLSPANIKKANVHINHYLRDAEIALKAFSRAHEYEADLLGVEYVAKAGFNPESCIKMWTETMPHGTDKIVARLLPEGTEDPGHKEPTVFINKEKQMDEEPVRANCAGLRGPEKNKCKRKKRKAKVDSANVPEEVLELLRTHPSDRRRAKALKIHVKTPGLIKRLSAEGKQLRNTKLLRDWSYDKESDSVIISSNLIDPKKVGLEQTGTTGIDVDSFLSD